MQEERLNYLSVLSVENGITKSLSYEEAIKEYATKICRKKVLCVCVCVSGSYLIKILCYFSVFRDACGIFPLFLNLWFAVISFLILNRYSFSYVISYS